ncbi:uncharacterized protein RHO25_006909 [Cercospora beticola]|uniref:Uncharacterized protein n=1 Tax=Cercospora beticola TaxID=122368 RepID=A0ABZ0NRV7_CERBT|nr:hypothetical protein RHO25_006909 [Cercospora beticola]
MPTIHETAETFVNTSASMSEARERDSANGTFSATSSQFAGAPRNESPPPRGSTEDRRAETKPAPNTDYTLPYIARHGSFTPTVFEHEAEYYVREFDRRRQMEINALQSGLDSNNGATQRQESRSPAANGKNVIASAVPRGLRPGPPSKVKPMVLKSILKNRIEAPPQPTLTKSPNQIPRTPPAATRASLRYPPPPAARSPSQELLAATTASIPGARHPALPTNQSPSSTATSSSNTPKCRQHSEIASPNSSATSTPATSIHSTSDWPPPGWTTHHNNFQRPASDTPLSPKILPKSGGLSNIINSINRENLVICQHCVVLDIRNSETQQFGDIREMSAGKSN